MRYDENDRKSSNVDDRQGHGGGDIFRFPVKMGERIGRRIHISFPSGRGGRHSGGLSLISVRAIGGIMLMLGINPLKFLSGGGLPYMNGMPQMPRVDGGPTTRIGNKPFNIQAYLETS